ncbi:hypothetical protein ACS7SF_17255 [Ralstonia sp. 25C]|uniref:hypothetical protein n=1 Tax=Ralstonia sp. 25C TaxID=3447363 RepID=UPI003F74B114
MKYSIAQLRTCGAALFPSRLPQHGFEEKENSSHGVFAPLKKRSSSFAVRKLNLQKNR